MTPRRASPRTVRITPNTTIARLRAQLVRNARTMEGMAETIERCGLKTTAEFLRAEAAASRTAATD
jgi:hypothetical protein